MRMRPRLADESGATAVAVVMSMFMIMAAGAVAVDGGMLWATKRDLVPATDSAALAAVSYLNELDEPLKTVECTAAAAENDVVGPRVSSVASVVTDYLTTNQGSAVALDDLEVHGCGTQIIEVEVTARQQAPQFLSQALGFAAWDVPSSSTAHVGPVSSGPGLAPIGFCYHAPELQTYLGNPDPGVASISPVLYSGATPGPVYRLWLSGPLASSDCGDTLPGNWGWTTFDDNSPGASTLRDWIIDGYQEIVDLGAPTNIAPAGSTFADLVDPDEECAPSEDNDHLCHGQTGLINAAISTMDSTWVCPATTHTDLCPSFVVTVYDVGEGSGTNARYHPVAFVGIVLRAMDKQGSDTYMDLEFVEARFEGPIREVTEDTGVRYMRICSVDGDPATGRCG